MVEKTPSFKGSQIEVKNAEVVPSRVPAYVKCKVCGKGPSGADWLKPVNPDKNCREFVHLSHITNGPSISAESGFILRNS